MLLMAPKQMTHSKGTAFAANFGSNRALRGLGCALGASALCATLLTARGAQAQPTGKPPEDAKALVAGPGGGAAAPVKKDELDVTNAAVSAGGQLSTGNSRQLAGTASGEFDTRFSDNGLGAAILANYGESTSPGHHARATAENLQGRLRYDRYLLDQLSVFLINTGRHDRFQGLDFRYNLDPGVKYLFVQESATKAWGELGYDLQYDVRRNDARNVFAADGVTVVERLDKTAVDHSARVFAGFTHAFNDAVNLNLGLEYLQSFVESTQYRLNFDALFAAKLGAGLALGAGFGARFDHAPLPDKKQLDTLSVISIIYSFSDAAPPEPPPPPPPCAPVPCSAAPLCAPTPAPAPAPAPAVEPAPAPVAPAPATPPVAPAPAP